MTRFKLAFAQVAGEACRRDPVVLKEGGVGIDGLAETLAEDEFGACELERGVEVGSAGALNTVIGPERLRTIHVLDLFEGLFAGVS